MRQQPARDDEKVVSIEELKRAREHRASVSRSAPEVVRLKPAARPDSQEKQPQHKQQHQVVGRFGLAALFALLALLALVVVMGMNIFQIREVQVKGNSTISAQDIIALSGIKLGENIFKVDTAMVKSNIESDSLLELSGIERVFPDKIKIEIRQRIPHGAIAYMGRYVIIDEMGCVLDIKDKLPAGQYPLLTGMDIKRGDKGMPVESHDQASLDAMGTVLSSLYKNKALLLIAQIDFKDLLNIRLLTRDGLVIELGKPTDLDAKAVWITSAIPELRQKGYTKGVLYLTSAKGPVYSATQESVDSPADNTANPKDTKNTKGTAQNTDTPQVTSPTDNAGGN